MNVCASKLLVLIACLVASRSVRGGVRAPECVAASQAKLDHLAECKGYDVACRGGDRDACSKQVSSCSLLGNARFSDAVLRACGMPKVREPEPEAPAVTRSSTGAGVGAASPRNDARKSSKGALELPRSGVHVYGGSRCSIVKSLLEEISSAGIGATFHDVGRDPDENALAKRYRDYFYNGYIVLLVVDGRPERFEFGSVAATLGRQ